jgi:hypothetical protein
MEDSPDVTPSSEPDHRVTKELIALAHDVWNNPRVLLNLRASVDHPDSGQPITSLNSLISIQHGSETNDHPVVRFNLASYIPESQMKSNWGILAVIGTAAIVGFFHARRTRKTEH